MKELEGEPGDQRVVVVIDYIEPLVEELKRMCHDTYSLDGTSESVLQKLIARWDRKVKYFLKMRGHNSRGLRRASEATDQIGKNIDWIRSHWVAFELTISAVRRDHQKYLASLR